MIVRQLWNGLDANLALATPMREDGDTIESFNRRVRNNEAAAKKVHDLNKPRKSAAAPIPSQARVQRLSGNLAAKGTVQATTETSNNRENVRPGGFVRPPRRAPPRPCRGCGGDHWDLDCSKKDSKDEKKRVIKVEDVEEIDIDQEDPD